MSEPMTPEQLAEIREWLRAREDSEGFVPIAEDMARMLLAEVGRLRAQVEQHALANDGCVPGAAYRDLADRLTAVAAVRDRVMDPAQHVIEGPLIGRLKVGHWLDAALASDTEVQS